MRIVKLKGGLGNQMFQYTFAKLIEKNAGDIVKLDFSFFKYSTDRSPLINNFNLTLPSANTDEISSVCKINHMYNPSKYKYKLSIFLESKINQLYFLEPDRAYIDPKLIQHYLYFDGYWQSYKYYQKIEDIIKYEFMPKCCLSEITKNRINLFNSQNSVFVGVRKGDYVKAHAHYGSFDSAYYQKAMKIISEKIASPIFYIFSDDISWCKNNIDWNNYNIIYREPKDQTNDFEELILMKSCKHAIIVNSSYHWWGATLINNPHKIICCPEKWFFDKAPIDIIPENWIKIRL